MVDGGEGAGDGSLIVVEDGGAHADVTISSITPDTGVITPPDTGSTTTSSTTGATTGGADGSTTTSTGATGGGDGGGTTAAHDGGSTGGDMCPSSCTTNAECQSGCPAVTGALNCCDAVTMACFQSASSACPGSTSTTGSGDAGHHGGY